MRSLTDASAIPSGDARPSPEWSAAERPLTSGFARSVERFGERLAIESGGNAITYRELDDRSDRIARRLVAAGVEPGSRVALLLDQGVAFIAGLLGVLKAGCAFVPLDPTYPSDRNAFMLCDSAAVYLLTEEAHLGMAQSVAPDSMSILCSDDDPAVDMEAGAEKQTHGLARAEVAPDDIAYVLYTSGSTGRPKGVMQSHASVVHNALRHQLEFAITESDRQSLFYPCSVYGGIRDIFDALLVGASLHHYPVRELGYAGIEDWLEERRITIYCSVASVFRRFARELEGCDRFPDLRIVKLGGEAPYAADIELFQRHFHRDAVMSCGLGSTETGMSRRFPITRETELWGPEVPLGRPVEGIEIVLVDEQRHPVARGEIGEIVIRSRFITSGYFGRDDLNESVITECDDGSGERLFFTGDLGQFVACEGGDLLYHRGRRDHQIKVNGNRVEPHEIESALVEHASIKDAVVLARDEREMGTKLVAHLVLEPGQGEDLTIHSIRERLSERLPRHMIPGHYREVREIPLTPNGKIDRLALAGLEGRTLEVGRKRVDAVTPRQRRMGEIWADLLGVKRVGITDSFFDLGGDSLMAAQLLVRIEQEFGYAPSLATLMRYDTVEGMAEWSEGDSLSDADDRVVWLTGGAGVGANPLFVLPGRGGSVLSFMNLVERVQTDRPVIGLQLPGMADDDEVIESVEGIATALLRHVRTIQPVGPVRLLGYSFGGLVAYEMGCQLADQHEEVAYLGLIDAMVPGARSKRPALERAVLHAQDLLNSSEAGGLASVASKLREKLRRRARRRPQGTATVARALSPFEERLQRVDQASCRAAARFRPRPFPGEVTLLRCEQSSEWMRFDQVAPDHGWAPLAGELRCVDIPGAHLSVFEPEHIDGLARAVSETLSGS